jgi:starch synthase
VQLLFLSSEVAPWSKTGGLADVAGALPAALAALGHEVHVVTPRYGSLSLPPLTPGPAFALDFPFGRREVTTASLSPTAGLTVHFLFEPHAFAREALYGQGQRDESDNAERFTTFTLGALTLAQALGLDLDAVHFNDWQTGLGPLALKTGYRHVFPRARSVFTVHNLAYQGGFPAETVGKLGLPWSRFTPEGFEFWGHLSFMKAGLVTADVLTTVSPSYAKEIQGPELGMGLDGVLRGRGGALHGIVNGIDETEWNPATDVRLPARYSAADLSGKALCRQALLERLKLTPPPPGAPVFGVISRIVAQKGVDLLHRALPAFLEHGAAVVVLGSGSPELEGLWRQLAQRAPGQVGVQFGYDEGLAHLIEAGADFFLMPSRFEPCGLNQMYSQRYGTPPVVHAVGGLRDTVVEEGLPHASGIVFHAPTVDALRGALVRAVQVYRSKERYRSLQLEGMGRDFSWGEPARRYEALYRGA